MEQFDIYKQKEWLIDNGFVLEDVAEDHISVFMKPLGLITFVAELQNNRFKYTSHVSWDGKTDHWAEYTFKEFKNFNECLNKLI